MTDSPPTGSIVADQAAMDADTEYRDSIITAVTPFKKGDGWSFDEEEGWSFWVDAKYGVEPHIGDSVRFYGRGIGYTVRGLRIGDRVAYYRTAAEEAERSRLQIEAWNQEKRDRFESVRAAHDRRIQVLPFAFRQRIATFQRTNPDFRWEYEDYELSVCEQAVLFADTLKTPEAVRAFAKANSSEQKQLVPGLDDGHSGNSFAFACRLAREFLTDPAIVIAEHGAMAIIVGCEQYGCPHDAAPSPTGGAQ